MGHLSGKLTPLEIKKAKKPGLLADGGNLYLQITKTGGKSWLFRFMIDGKSTSMGLGSLAVMPLDEAREAAHRCNKQLHAGINPKQQRDAEKSALTTARARTKTFKECAEAYIDIHTPGWKNAKHTQQWSNTLAAYAYPTIGHLAVGGVNTELVMQCLRPIWNTKTETATRVRNRIELILDWAKANGYRDGENPAMWRGHLDKLLPKPKKVAPVEHFPALPYEEIGSLIKSLRARHGTAARALEFAILTASRTHVVLGAMWDEINIDKKLWIIPAERMKIPREHRVPLSNRVIEILHEMKEQLENEFIFPGRGKSRHLAVLATPLKQLERRDITVHGFRSTFRDWASETTSHPSEVAEMALAHTVGNKVEEAYRRGDLFEKRRHLMEDWAAYCEETSNQNFANK
jgi:integrase